MRVKLSSKVISRINYSKRTRILTVYFRKGKPIAYKNVSLDVVEAFAASGSPGAFYEDHIKHSYQHADVFIRNMLIFAVKMLIGMLIGGFLGLAPHLLAGKFSSANKAGGNSVQQPAEKAP